jgi:hypothetical protein
MNILIIIYVSLYRYGATIKTVNKADNSYHLQYDDGDEETDMNECKIRKKSTINVKKSLVVDENIEMGMNDTGLLIETVSYSIGEDVEGLYEKGDDWYKAKVKHVTITGKYNLVYEDGDVEDDVSIERMRKINPIHPNGEVHSADRTPKVETAVISEIIGNTEHSTDDVIDISNPPNEMSTEVDNGDKVACPDCSFMNVFQNQRCELCDSLLHPTPTNKGDISDSPKPHHNEASPSSSSKPHQNTPKSLNPATSNETPISTTKSANSMDYLDNYLDELSDDEEEGGGGLSAEPTIYGEVSKIKTDMPIFDKKEIKNEEILKDEKGGDKVLEEEEYGDEGDYEEDFDA